VYDSQIRQAFHNKILHRAHNDDDILVVDELGIQNGNYRADIAVLNGKLEGFEIKGEHDTLDRLPNQVEAYNSIFKNISLITCERYLDKCISIIPDWWGIYLASPSEKDAISFTKIRPAKLNKQVDKYALAQLLWKDEAINAIAKHLDYKIPSRATREDLYSLISKEMSKTDLSKLVIQELKKRQVWR
jgi:hypothetical protein